MIYTLLNKSGITSSSWGGDVISTQRRNGEALVQTTVDGDATIDIQGRMTSNSAWVSLNSSAYSAETKSFVINVYPQMRTVVTGVDTTATATGGVSSTPATGSISISENPSGALDPILITILGTSASPSRFKIFPYTSPDDEDTLLVVADGAGGTLNFEFDYSSVHHTGTVVFSGGVVAGEVITIYDIAGKSRAYYFSTAAGDNPDGTQAEVLVGNGTTDAATNFQVAVEADWMLGKIYIEPAVSSSTVTLKQSALQASGESPPRDTRISKGSDVTSTSWTGGSTSSVLNNSTYLPIAATDVEAEAQAGLYTAFQHQVSIGRLTTVNVAILASYNGVEVEMKTPGTHHNADSALLPLNATAPGSSVSVETSGATNGTNPIRLEINESSETSGYTHIDRVEGEEVEMIIARLATALSATSWSGGTLTATNDYNNKSATLHSTGASLTSFGNKALQVVKDPHNIVTVTGMTGGAAGVTVLCNMDVPQSS